MKIYTCWYIFSHLSKKNCILQFSEEDICKAIATIPAKSAPSPDRIPAVLLRNCSNSLAQPLYILWSKPMETGEIPLKLKHGLVTPIYKGGDKSMPANYRPVTLTSHIVKIFEKIVVKRLTDYMVSLNLFNKHQHGFRKGRSCLSQLLEHYQRILSGLEEQGSVDVVYLDFCKAFDKVDHKVLLEKLQVIGVAGKLFQWIGEFLIQRSQSVVVDGVASSPGQVSSGVPQGSVLGPLLFLILMSDIDCDLSRASASSFADDTRIIMCISEREDHLMMQDELQKVYRWANENVMVFNDVKFDHVQYDRDQNSEIREYLTADGTKIRKPTEVKDLGVYMSTDAGFRYHIDQMILKAKRQAGWVLRTISTRETYPMMTLYKSTILPILEYCSQLWSPVKIGDLRKIEAVQRNFTSKINGIRDKSYWDRLKHLKMYSLERRRERYIIIYIHKIISGDAPNFEDSRFQIQTKFSDRRGLECGIPPLNSNATSKIRLMVDNSFVVRGPKLFNCIPKEIRNTNLSSISFKNKLDNFLTRVPDLPSLSGFSQSAASNSLLDQVLQMRRENCI